MSKRITPIIILALLLILALMTSLFIVFEGQEALVVHLGKIRRDGDGKAIKYNPGIHFKLPYVDTVKRFDIRLQSFDVPSSRVLTEEQKSVDVDYYVVWRIKDTAIFFTRTNGSELRARDILTRKINDALRASFGDKKLNEVISDDRSNIIHKLTQSASKSAENIGAEIVDVRIKRIDYPQEVTLSVYERMKSQREQVAKKYRSEGEMEQEEIKAVADKKAAIVVAEAKKDAAKLVALGTEQAAALYNVTYNENKPLFQVWRTLTAYERSFDDKTILVIDPADNAFTKLFQTEGDKN